MHVQCSCTRAFILDEMYYCIKCAKGLCRFCLTEEIESFYCRSCFMVYNGSEAATFKNKCSKYYTCPLCFNVMTMMLTLSASKQKILYYNCMHCQFNTMSLEIRSTEDAHELLMKVLLYKGRYQKAPH